MANFNALIVGIIANEGGYVHDPDDPGGETKYGISKRVHPTLDIKNLTIAQAEDIYRTHYWNRIQGDKIISNDVAWVIFDAAVNIGVKRAIKRAQRIVDVVDDGIVGEKTLAAINKYHISTFCEKYKLLRIKYYIKLCRNKPVLRKYLYSWIRRTVE